ncbi:glycosyltransferase, partial [Candidatus Roizmanbacteria bacterium]|nr:glycosyltransferase [Candidatus Roizmanbacteria bacterium]
MKRSTVLISVVVPIYNEGEILPELISRIDAAVSSYTKAYEIIFIDDCSTDSTGQFFKELQNPHVIYQKKRGRRGKGYSLNQGFAIASGKFICMIDGDLQYPPEEIPAMIKLLKHADVVVAHRKEYRGSRMRKVLSRGFRTLFSKFLFGLPHDVQSGLKVFTREVIQTVQANPASAWTLDLEFLLRAREAGFRITDHPIDFTYRKKGTSSVSYLQTAWEIGTNALSLKFKKIQPQHIPPKGLMTMAGAGIGYNRRKYITHTTLPHQATAMRTTHASQLFFISFALAFIVMGAVVSPLTTAVTVVAILSFIYFVDALFNLYVVLKSLHVPQEISVSDAELKKLDEKKLPVYSILCPLYREGHIIPQFLEAINKLDWPKQKLDVLLLLEEDDAESIEAVARMNIPSYVRTVVVPDSLPKTKPKACNYGLSQAKGEYLVIYDAEDMPDPQQLKKAYIAFQKIPRDVLCLQAKLNYYNPGHNLLTRFFTAEYSLWFDVTLTGLQSINTSIPLGGTSNHFRRLDLMFLRGWDPFNVTEDADLGIRLFKKGYKTAIIDSTTYEEANSHFFNWMRQRSRWLKGYMQTYLVHTRQLFHFSRHRTWHALIFQLVIGGKIAFALINPILWIATIAYFTFNGYVGTFIESLYPTTVFYMAAFSLVFGNFLFMYYYMIGCIKREQYDLVKYVLLIPVYWLMISIACGIALYQLIFKPHYWEKTVHGLHLKKKLDVMVPEVVVETIEAERSAS